jgi:hypothetical protein
MRAAAGRAFVSSLRRISHEPRFFKSPDFSSGSLNLVSKVSVAPVFRREQDGMELESVSSLWSHCTAPFASQVVMDGHWRSSSGFSLGGVEGVPVGFLRARAQNHVILQPNSFTALG